VWEQSTKLYVYYQHALKIGQYALPETCFQFHTTRT